MNERDPRDDMGLPYDPDTPEEFANIIRDDFEKWWNELDPPGSVGGVSLERETALATWNASVEYFWHHLELVYDTMKGSSEVWKEKAWEEAAYAVSQFSGDSFSFKLDDYMKWHDEHAQHVRREYNNGTVTITFRPPSD